MLVKSSDGVIFDVVADFTELERREQKMNESNIAFIGRKSYAVVRGNDDQGYFGMSSFPYKKWNWKKMSISVGGPALMALDNNTLLLGCRDYGQEQNRGKIAIYCMSKSSDYKAEKFLLLESTSDSSYPSFVKVEDNKILVTYYCGNSKHSNIYLAVLDVE